MTLRAIRVITHRRKETGLFALFDGLLYGTKGRERYGEHEESERGEDRGIDDYTGSHQNPVRG